MPLTGLGTPNVMDPDLEPAERPIEEEIATGHRGQAMATVAAAVRIACGLFVLVLALHIILVAANANPANGFATFIDNWANTVSLGMGGLFTIGLLNYGIAAVLWLVIGAVLTYLVDAAATPVIQRYRRRVLR